MAFKKSKFTIVRRHSKSLGAYQQVGGFAGDAVVVEIVGRMHRMVVVGGRAVGGAVFEYVRHRSGLRATG